MGRVQPTVKTSLRRAKVAHQYNHGVAKFRARQSSWQLIEDIRVTAQTAPPEEALGRKDRRDTSNELRISDLSPASFEYGEDQLTVAAVLAAAELEAPRDFGPEWVAQRVGGSLESTNKKLLGYWEGRAIGVARFLASAAAFFSAKYGGALTKHVGRGSDSNLSPGSCVASFSWRGRLSVELRPSSLAFRVRGRPSLTESLPKRLWGGRLITSRASRPSFRCKYQLPGSVELRSSSRNPRKLSRGGKAARKNEGCKL